MFNEQRWKYLFSRRLMDEMDRLGMSVESLSIATDLNMGTIYNCLSGKVVPSTKTILCIAYVLGIEPNRLINFPREVFDEY